MEHLMASSRNTEMPNLFIIGAAKCGTTSLHHYLGLHPEISMSKVKEPMYFLPEEFRASWTHSPVPHSREEYLSLFEPGPKVRGESSTIYSAHPIHPGIPGRIHRESPDARLIYLVGDPVERVPSCWVQRMGARERSNRNADGPIPLADHIGALDDPGNFYTWPGMYMTQIRHYLEVFPREAILVLDSDALKTDREKTLTEAFEFLGVDPRFFDPGFTEERNTLGEKKMESSAYVRLTHSKVLRRMVDLMPERLREASIEAVRGPLLVQAEKPALEPDLRSRLEEYFRPEVETLREFTGQDFEGWSI